MSTRAFHHLASKWNIGTKNLNNVWSLKMNVERSKRECLKLKAQHIARRRKCVERIGRLGKWKRES